MTGGQGLEAGGYRHLRVHLGLRRLSRQTGRLLRLYGPGGAWVELFRRAPGYVDTWLLADVDRVGRFVTVDRWESRESFDNFRSGFAREFDALDQLGQQLTSGEMLLGEFSGPASSS